MNDREELLLELEELASLQKWKNRALVEYIEYSHRHTVQLQRITDEMKRMGMDIHEAVRMVS